MRPYYRFLIQQITPCGKKKFLLIINILDSFDLLGYFKATAKISEGDQACQKQEL